MKTPTLIVRLVGLYLLTSCSIILIQLHHAQSMSGLGGLGSSQQSIVDNFQLEACLGWLAGIAASLFAGRLARLLTSDSEPKKETDDFTAQLLKRK